MIAEMRPLTKGRCVPLSATPLNQAQADFQVAMPRITRHARCFFRHVDCQHHRTECISEVLGLCWKWWLHLVQRGKDPRQFVSVIADFAVRAVRAGRRVCGQLKAKDVMNERTQRRCGFKVESLPISTRTCQEDRCSVVGGQRRQDEYEERLRDNTRTPPDEQAMFRLDFAAWLKSLTSRERKIVRAMARNERTQDLSQQFGVSPSRISQLRRDFALSWRDFCDEARPGQARATA
jgi:hypothetical protein